MTDEIEEREREQIHDGRTTKYALSSGEFIFDPEIDDQFRDVLFEFIIAGTWEKALAAIDKNSEITGRQVFWEAVKEYISCCQDDTLRHHLAGHCLIAFRHLTDDLPADERANLDRFPKPRPRGDVEKAHRIDAGREAAVKSGDRGQEKRIARGVLAIDPCATPVWLSLASVARHDGDERTLRRCISRLALSLMGELDLGLFAMRHGVQNLARSCLEGCLHSIAGYEALLPRVVVTALTALANLHGDLAQYGAAVGYLRRACEIAENCMSSSKEIQDEYEQEAFAPIEVLRLRTSLAYGLLRTGQLDEAEDQLQVMFGQATKPRNGAGADDDTFKVAQARVVLGLGEIARRRGEDERALVLMVQGIEHLGLRVENDGRLSTAAGEAWRVDEATPFANLSAAAYPHPRPDSFDPQNTWFADFYEKFVLISKLCRAETNDHPAELDADCLRTAMAQPFSTQRGKALSRLGTRFYRMGRYDRAEEAHRAALAEYRETESGWSAIADSEQILAEILLATGRAADAMDLADAAIAHFPKVHDLEAEIISISLAQAYFLKARIRAQLTSSTTEADRALILDDARMAANHLNNAQDYDEDYVTVENVGILLIALGAFEEAAELLVRSASVNISIYPRYIDVSTSPSVALDRIGSPHSLWLLLKLLNDGSVETARFLPPVFAMLFGVRNLSISALRDALERRTTAGEVTRSLLEELRSVREQIHLTRLLDKGREKLELLARGEREIMRQLHQVTSSYKNKVPTSGSIYAMLQLASARDEVHIEFVSFTPITIGLRSELELQTEERRTAAIIFKASEPDSSIQFFDLGEESKLLSLVNFLVRPYLFGKSKWLESDIAIALSMGWENSWDDDENVFGQMRAIYLEQFNATLKPLVREISEYRRWNIGVRSVLALLAFDFLPVRSDYAGNQIEIIRDPILAGHAAAVLSPALKSEFVVIGDPAFGNPEPEANGKHDFRSWSLAALPGARVEAEAIADLLGVPAILGSEASREFLLSRENPSILHIATHGFYMRPRQREQAAEAVRNSLDWRGQPANNALARLTRDDPYSHIGLALAGADRWLDDASQSGFSPGIAFGDEIALMNLLHTDLVVLSCCDSGLGQIHITHGVINLPRAFLCAGAKAVLASLWPLADEFVKPVMMDFYRNLLVGDTVISALARAKRDAIARGDPKLVWGALQLYGSGDHLIHLPSGRVAIS